MRLIDADALPRHGNRGGLVHWKDIENAPTIDAVQVVRCKDCMKQPTCNFTQYQGIMVFVHLQSERTTNSVKLIEWIKRPKCPNNYRCPDCVHCDMHWEGIKFRGFTWQTN